MAGVPTVRTVAAAVGVSPATVSNAYNRPERLSSATRNRIMEAAHDLGYSPHAAARSLRMRHAGSVGVILTVGLSYAFTDPYYIELLAGLSEVAEHTHAALTFIPIAALATVASEDERRAALAAVERAVIDGAIADGLEDDHPAMQVLAQRGIPLVRSSDTGTGRRVYVDDLASGRLIGRHLAAIGHQDVTVVCSHPLLEPGNAQEVEDESALYPYSRLRLEGIRAGLGEGTRVRAITGGLNSPTAGRAAASLALSSHRPSAIAADSDVLAVGVLAALEDARLEPGTDVAVTGFDDLPLAADANLTTVRQPIREKGNVMGRMLLDTEFTADCVQLPTELIVRMSTRSSGAGTS